MDETTGGARRRQARGRGQTLVEFALVAPVLFLLVFGIIEFGLLLHAYITMQHAVDEAARYAVTGEGYDLPAGTREARIIEVARRACPSLMINEGAYAGQRGWFHVGLRSSTSPSNDPAAVDAGKANDFVRLTIDFNHPAFTWILGGTNAHVPLHTEALVLNERFARPLGDVADLPPQPAPTRTPSGDCYTLIAGVAEGSGSVGVTTPPNCAGGRYRAGTSVGLSASPGGSFHHWSGDASGTNRSTTIAMNRNKTVLAHFSTTVFTLQMSIAGTCGGSVSPGVGAHSYSQGAVASVGALPASGCEFVGWSGAVSGTTNPTTLTMNADASVTANFGEGEYTLTVFHVGTGRGSTSPAVGTHEYERDAVVPLGPGLADLGSVFVGWICGGHGCSSVTMDRDQTVFARFEPEGTVPTQTPPATATGQATPTASSTPTITPTFTASPTSTNSPTPTNTPTATNTATPSSTPTATSTPSKTPPPPPTPLCDPRTECPSVCQWLPWWSQCRDCCETNCCD